MGEDATLEALMSTGRDLDLLFDNIGNGDIPAAIIPARSVGMAWSASAAAGSTANPSLCFLSLARVRSCCYYRWRVAAGARGKNQTAARDLDADGQPR